MRSFKGEIINNVAILSGLDKQVDCDRGKLKEIKDDPSYCDELKDSIRERIKNVETKQEGRLEALSINREKLRTQVSRIKETIAKILDSDSFLTEKLRTLFREEGITIVAILTAIGMIISTIVLPITGGSGGAAPPKDMNKLVEWFLRDIK